MSGATAQVTTIWSGNFKLRAIADRGGCGTMPTLKGGCGVVDQIVQDVRAVHSGSDVQHHEITRLDGDAGAGRSNQSDPARVALQAVTISGG